MGTRNLTMVYQDEQFKVAQYGQWDGYPEGLGVQLLHFLKTVDLQALTNTIDEVSFYTKDELYEIKEIVKEDII
jgi:hypothetical protein